MWVFVGVGTERDSFAVCNELNMGESRGSAAVMSLKVNT